ncbi:MAG TPA: sugar phosphate nucleotidyltransferase [Candidatus Limiplasma sp.]|nr:sugar phosphate nucleotidyltransferase [Candidatus Limiplasma sp.]HRX07552.1 sugar phosphate nucleotidyltransferase [Candidatus Limiplasma sp.]
MSKGPILLIMAAGMGSRYGGLKQMDPVGAHGEFILDYSLYDAKRAGFERAVLVIKRETEPDFREFLLSRVKFPVTFAYQELTDLPAGYTLPGKRMKPWGTAHAVYAAREQLDAPFCVINADDFYGAESFNLAARHLQTVSTDDDFAMIGYLLKNTLSDTGHVARGICNVAGDGTLQSIIERTHIISTVDGPLMTEDEQVYTRLSAHAVVSMNMWCFPKAMARYLGELLPAFLDKALKENVEKAEFYLPQAVDTLVSQRRARVKVYESTERWYGVTYKADRPMVEQALRQMSLDGTYPQTLWGEHN